MNAGVSAREARATSAGPGVLLVGNHPPPYGGVPKHIEELAPALSRRGWRVHILSGGNTGIEHKDGVTIYKDARPWLRRRADTLQFTARVLRTSRRAILRDYARLAPPRRFARYLGRAALGAHIVREHAIDVIGGYNLTLGGPVASLLGELYGLPVIISNFGEIYSHRQVVERERELIRRMTERAARLLCMTRHCAGSYAELGLHPEVQIVPYGLDLVRFQPGDGAERRRELGWDERDRIVLFVGRMIADMGLDTVLATIPLVLARFPRARFLLAGGRGDLTDAAAHAAATYGEIVKVMPDVPAAVLPSLYHAADLVLVPTKGARACGSLAAGEAAASAKAVVGARVGGVPEYVVDGETGILVAPDEPEALAVAVSALLEDDRRREAMGRAGRAFVERTFDVARTNDAIDRVLREVLAGRTVMHTTA